jgi:hypothetical protein
MVWPAFLVFAAGQIAFVSYVRRHGPPALAWTIAVVIAAAAALAALGIVSEWTRAQISHTLGLQPFYSSPWERHVDIIRWSTGPTLWVFAFGQAVLIAHPRSQVVEATLVVLSGAALSWAVAIWLVQQPLPEIVFRLFRLPGTLGLVVSSLGFAVSGGMWASTTRLVSGHLSNQGAV